MSKSQRVEVDLQKWDGIEVLVLGCFIELIKENKVRYGEGDKLVSPVGPNMTCPGASSLGKECPKRVPT